MSIKLKSPVLNGNLNHKWAKLCKWAKITNNFCMLHWLLVLVEWSRHVSELNRQITSQDFFAIYVIYVYCCCSACEPSLDKHCKCNRAVSLPLLMTMMWEWLTLRRAVNGKHWYLLRQQSLTGPYKRHLAISHCPTNACPSSDISDNCNLVSKSNYSPRYMSKYLKELSSVFAACSHSNTGMQSCNSHNTYIIIKFW